jgi:geranylgeranyl diphosphate synthase, type I
VTTTTPRPVLVVDAAAELAVLRDRLQAALADFLAGQAARLTDLGPELAPVAGSATRLVLGGGKRLRPAFAYWAWHGAARLGPGGTGPDDAVLRAVGCLELLHACALVHDDVMDDSDLRRGAPAAHQEFAALHRSQRWSGPAGGFGRSAAILLGDLCLVWADGLLHGAGLPAAALARARTVYDELRAELLAGQYLDLVEQARGGAGLGDAGQRALRVARLKSGGYTVARPLRFGAALAAAPPGLDAAYQAYGEPLGEAFQLRDDVLGVYGEPAATGKPAGDDLRGGKRTVLVALATERADRAQATALRRLLGNPRLGQHGIETLRQVIEATGALAEVERMIAERTERALTALATAGLDATTAAVLTRLALAATVRGG